MGTTRYDCLTPGTTMVAAGIWDLSGMLVFLPSLSSMTGVLSRFWESRMTSKGKPPAVAMEP
jgi:hypothetical protein